MPALVLLALLVPLLVLVQSDLAPADAQALPPVLGIDTSFGNGGVAETGHPRDERPLAMAVDEGGRIVVLGLVDGFRPTLHRWLPDGSVDTTFGRGGTLEPAGRDVGALAVSGDMIVVAGTGIVLTSDFNNGVSRYLSRSPRPDLRPRRLRHHGRLGHRVRRGGPIGRQRRVRRHGSRQRQRPVRRRSLLRQPSTARRVAGCGFRHRRHRQDRPDGPGDAAWPGVRDPYRRDRARRARRRTGQAALVRLHA